MDGDRRGRYFAHQRNAIRLGHGDRRSASEPTDAGRDVRARLAARDVYRRHHPQCRAAVHGAADVYQDGAAPFWRRAVGVVGGYRVLPDCAARGLRLRPRAHALRGPSRIGRDPSSSDDRRCIRAATVDPHRLGPPAGSRGSAVADGIVHGLDRSAVFCARRQQPFVAGLVRAHRPPRRERPLFPLCRQQCRKLLRARIVSDRD